jgi:cytochrome oxidase Cu insertion factor (SCO1/SenC/PrrC family)
MLCSIAIMQTVTAFNMATPFKTFTPSSSLLIGAGPGLSLRSRGSTARSAVMKAPDVNAQAPAFKLPDSTGKLVGLDNFKGKWTVLYFCKSCWL